MFSISLMKIPKDSQLAYQNGRLDRRPCTEQAALKSIGQRAAAGRDDHQLAKHSLG